MCPYRTNSQNVWKGPLYLHTIAHTILRNSLHLFDLKIKQILLTSEAAYLFYVPSIKACYYWLLRTFKKTRCLS